MQIGVSMNNGEYMAGLKAEASTPLRTLAESRVRVSGMAKSAEMNNLERLQLLYFNAVPQSFVPDDYKGKLVMDAYAKRMARAPKGKKLDYRSEFVDKILKSKGTSASIAAYLNGRGKHLVPKLVQHELGDQWYTGIAKLVSRTPFGRNHVVDKVLDRTLPKFHGSTDVPKMYMYAGGMV